MTRGLVFVLHMDGHVQFIVLSSTARQRDVGCFAMQFPLIDCALGVAVRSVCFGGVSKTKSVSMWMFLCAA